MKLLSAINFAKQSLQEKNTLYRYFLYQKANKTIVFLFWIISFYLLWKISFQFAVFIAILIEIVSYPLDFFLEYNYSLLFLKNIDKNREYKAKNTFGSASLMIINRFSSLFLRLISLNAILYSFLFISRSINQKEAVQEVFLFIQLVFLSLLLLLASFYLNNLLSALILLDFMHENNKIGSCFSKSCKIMKESFKDYFVFCLLDFCKITFCKKYFSAKSIYIFVTIKEWEEKDEQKRNLCRYKKSNATGGFFKKRKRNFRKTSA